jgi:peroxiredoxin
MRAHIWRLFLSIALCFSQEPAQADEQAGKNYVALPITTEYQRAQLGGGTAAYVQINTSAIAYDGRIDAAAFDSASFRGELAKLARGSKGSLMLYFRISGTNDKAPEMLLLEAAVKQICRDAGYKQIGIGHAYTWEDWKKELALVENTEGSNDAEERPVSSELVRVFPIRTRLSRFLTHDADCVVEIQRPIIGQESALSEELEASIASGIDQLQLARKRRMLLKVRSTKAGRPVVERLSARNLDRLSEADRFARRLGFESCIVSDSPQGGAPELLVGQTAPDFTLASLEGEQIRLQDFIRGKVALVTFWGVACGPCCQEAPHLSAAFEKYKDAGFTVVAVNAYDESKEAVSNFAGKEKLTHPIALMGQQIAEEKYAVGAYPTSFWVDHSGTIVDYTVDFKPGEEKRILKRIELMLRDRNEAIRSKAN